MLKGILLVMIIVSLFLAVTSYSPIYLMTLGIAIFCLSIMPKPPKPPKE